MRPVLFNAVIAFEHYPDTPAWREATTGSVAERLAKATCAHHQSPTFVLTGSASSSVSGNLFTTDVRRLTMIMGANGGVQTIFDGLTAGT